MGRSPKMPLGSSEAFVLRALEVRAAAATRLRVAKEISGIMDRDLGHQAGLQQRHTSSILAGEKWPSLRALLYLAFSLEVPLSQLLVPSPSSVEEDDLAAHLQAIPDLRALVSRVARWPAADVAALRQLATLLEHRRTVLPGFVAMLEATAVLAPPAPSPV